MEWKYAPMIRQLRQIAKAYVELYLIKQRNTGTSEDRGNEVNKMSETVELVEIHARR